VPHLPLQPAPQVNTFVRHQSEDIVVRANLSDEGVVSRRLDFIVRPGNNFVVAKHDAWNEPRFAFGGNEVAVLDRLDCR